MISTIRSHRKRAPNRQASRVHRNDMAFPRPSPINPSAKARFGNMPPEEFVARPAMPAITPATSDGPDKIASKGLKAGAGECGMPGNVPRMCGHACCTHIERA
ncbi:hypothetical protein G6F65_022640 [Rhizopus arrhizus]|nr:hypothetical protein G6F65_022640 [Rhizopus arrhizus]